MTWRRTARWGLLFFLALACRLADGAPFRFVVVGDNQQAISDPLEGVPERGALPAAMAALKPDFALHTGDLMYLGFAPDSYRKFVEYYRPLLATVPFFPTMGNHDAVGSLQYKRFLEEQLFTRNPAVFGSGYAEKFQVAYETDPTEYPSSPKDPAAAECRDRVPSGFSCRTFYSFRYENALFLSFEQGYRDWTNTPLRWVEETLQAARADASIDAIFVYLHHPLYATAMAENPPDPNKPERGQCLKPVRDAYEALFRKYGVTMVFSGHIHQYEHLWVPDDRRFTRAEAPERRYAAGDGIHYLITGGGGGTLCRAGERPNEPSYRYRQAALREYHFLLVTVDESAITVKAFQVRGSARKYRIYRRDKFVIEPAAVPAAGQPEVR
ncbi:metallophosphoesterase [Victivallis sp. Marseille-Q1083]|uniref:metallophosphoesterase family protein n=1 Tax=Victivallis sp. Marseille-Q1083 TaxID=2717288 RepID=UPI00158D777F|nr:metallophosphoesterase [Victivallis sp. Marseille-Q1083]